jgi:hypothetical protein
MNRHCDLKLSAVKKAIDDDIILMLPQLPVTLHPVNNELLVGAFRSHLCHFVGVMKALSICHMWLIDAWNCCHFSGLPKSICQW